MSDVDELKQYVDTRFAQLEKLVEDALVSLERALTDRIVHTAIGPSKTDYSTSIRFKPRKPAGWKK